MSVNETFLNLEIPFEVGKHRVQAPGHLFCNVVELTEPDIEAICACPSDDPLLTLTRKPNSPWRVASVA